MAGSDSYEKSSRKSYGGEVEYLFMVKQRNLLDRFESVTVVASEMSLFDDFS
jgi:hypothetical protein